MELVSFLLLLFLILVSFQTTPLSQEKFRERRSHPPPFGIRPLSRIRILFVVHRRRFFFRGEKNLIPPCVSILDLDDYISFFFFKPSFSPSFVRVSTRVIGNERKNGISGEILFSILSFVKSLFFFFKIFHDYVSSFGFTSRLLWMYYIDRDLYFDFYKLLFVNNRFYLY